MGKKKDFEQIIKLVRCNGGKDYILSKIKKYIDEYGISDGILSQLGRLYIHYEEFENAKDCLLKVENKEAITLYKLIIANFALENYEEVIKTYDELVNNKIFSKELSQRMFYMINRLYLYSKFKLGIPGNYEKFNLIINFNKENALKHIKKHTFKIKSEEKHSIFNPDINIEKLYDDIYNSINNSNKAYTDYLTDCYYFGYYNIGKTGNKQCDYLSVITLRHSNEIISMYPISLEEIEDNHPINTVKEIYSESKTKKLSQIDKFNLRYNKN